MRRQILPCYLSAMAFVQRNSCTTRHYASLLSSTLQSKRRFGAHLASERKLSDLTNQLAPSSSSEPFRVRDFGGLCFREVPESINRAVFVLGGPGSGKGTQCELLVNSYPCIHLSAGQLLRDEINKAHSPHASLIKKTLVEGGIVPVEVSLSLLARAMEEEQGKSLTFLIDGFPRNFDNFDGWFRSMEGIAVLSGVIVYQCPLGVLEARILSRAADSRRSDDNIETLQRRFRTFESQTVPVIDSLHQLSTENKLSLFEIPSDRPVAEVWEDTRMAINSIVESEILSANLNLLEAIAAGNNSVYESFCSDNFVAARSTNEALEGHENFWGGPLVEVSGASLSFVSGTKACLTYDRFAGSRRFTETRVWSHNGLGWKMCEHSCIQK